MQIASKGINKKHPFSPSALPSPEATITNNSRVAFQKLGVSLQAWDCVLKELCNGKIKPDWPCGGWGSEGQGMIDERG